MGKIIKSKTVIITILIFIFVIIFFANKGLDISLKRKTEGSTELYFSDHLNLPKQIEIGKPYNFDFITHNLEYKDFTYTYEVITSGQVDKIIGNAPKSANAYIDPGSSSYIFQMLIAGFLGASVGVKMFWKQISAKIKGIGQHVADGGT